MFLYFINLKIILLVYKYFYLILTLSKIALNDHIFRFKPAFMPATIPMSISIYAQRDLCSIKYKVSFFSEKIQVFLV